MFRCPKSKFLLQTLVSLLFICMLSSYPFTFRVFAYSVKVDKAHGRVKHGLAFYSEYINLLLSDNILNLDTYNVH